MKLVLALGFRAAPGLMTLALVRTLVASVAAAGYPVGYRLLVDGATGGKAADVVIGAVLVAVLFSLTWLLGVIGASQSTQLVDRCNLYLGERIARLVASAPGVSHFERPEDLREIDQLRDNRRALASAPRQLLSGLQIAVVAGVTVVLLASVYPPVLLVPVLGVLPWLGNRRAAKVQQRADDEMADQRRLVGDLFRLATTADPAKELRTYGVGGALARRHAQLGEAVRARSVRTALRNAGWEAAGWLGYAVGFVAAIIALVLRAAHGLATPGEVVMSVSLIRRAQTQVSRTTDTAGNLGTALRTARRLSTLEDTLRARPPGKPSAPPSRLTDGIRFDGVSFCYPGSEQPVLHEVDLVLPAGSTVALVGDNGAGKTTVVKLLTAMYQPTHGRILVDGLDLSTMEPAEWRRRTTATFQDFVRYQMTAQHVVGLGDLSHLDNPEAVREALTRADATGIVDALPDGLDTVLGRFFTGGRELSGGQWQRLALSRGVMRPEPLLTVLDEPTASLDAPTEAALFDRYAREARRSARRGAITLLVSHRFSTVQVADLIVVLEDGRVVETGSHEDLLDADGLYAHLFHLQARAYLPS